MLLVGHEYVADQRALTRKERDGKLYCLAVPILTVLSIELDSANRLVQLVKESELCTHAEVGHCQEAELLQDEFSRKLNLNRCR